MDSTLETLSGETQRIAADALSQGTLSKEDLLAAVVLLKVQRNDARKETERLRALLVIVERLLLQNAPSDALQEIRGPFTVTP